MSTIKNADNKIVPMPEAPPFRTFRTAAQAGNLSLDLGYMAKGEARWIVVTPQNE